jgi:mono/diheme cytochrome c family protein
MISHHTNLLKLSRCAFVVAILWQSAGLVPAAEDAPVDFEKQVAPILASRCVGCHMAGKNKGGLDLTSSKLARKGGDSGPAFEPGNPDGSELISRVIPEKAGEKPDMPRQGEPLSAAQVAILKQWVQQGAKWPESVVLKEKSKAEAATWWSLQKLADAKVPPLPAGFPEKWNQSPIDHFIAARLVVDELKPAPEADQRTLLRRLHYDLTGLPPTPEEMQSFVGDNRPDAYQRRVDRLLASPRYGERWGRYWLDVVRFGESNGFERNVLIENSWPFRDYVIRSLNQDKPFGQMIREHLAGDVVAPQRPEDMLGVAFLTVGPFDDVGNQDPAQAAQIRANTIDDMIVATSSAFLGLTIGCARCHDHKFDPILQSDYYKIQSAYDGTRQGARPIATAAQLDMRARHLRPLEERRNVINAALGELEKKFQARVAEELKTSPVKITKPVVSPQGIEEKLPNKPVKQVRLTIFNSDRDPNSSGGTRIEELELWTRGEKPANVALATAGTKIEAPSRKPGDFGDAYAAELMIDGKFGAAWVSPVAKAVVTLTLDRPTVLEKLLASSDRHGEIKGKSVYNVFVGDYILEVSTDGKTWETVADAQRERPAPSEAHEQARRRRLGYNADESAQMQKLRTELAGIEQKVAAVPNFPSVWAGSFAQPPVPNYVQLGGDPQRRGPEIVPGSPSYLKLAMPEYQLAKNAPENERRKALAEWIASPQNALTWRVLANRIWQLHFGTGLVDTPGDFGYMGGRPTHPELLEWLARRLLENGGRWKPIHREIVLSQAYRQSSASNAAGLKKDAQSRLFWRYPPRRLEGEQIRDSMLFVTGSLDERRGGPGFRLYQYLQDNVATYISLDDPGPESWRRSVYHQAPRAAKVDYLSDFDCPDNATSAPARLTTTTPLQSMTQWNHKFTMRMATKMAERVSGISDPLARVEAIYQLVYQRRPTAAEASEAAAFAHLAGWENLARVLLNSNEFLYME